MVKRIHGLKLLLNSGKGNIMKKNFTAFILAAAIVFGNTASAEESSESRNQTYFEYFDAAAGIRFNSMDKLSEFISINEGKTVIANVEPEVSDWLLTADYINILDKCKNNISDIYDILLTPTYASIEFKSEERTYELYDYYDDSWKREWDSSENYLKDEKKRKDRNAQKFTYNGREINYYSALNEGNYVWRQDGQYFLLRVREKGTAHTPDKKDLELCNVYKYKLKDVKSGWQTVNGKKYYYDKSGNKITKSSFVDGVRYKFTSDGVCHGKYTGWVKTTKAKRYYKNGVMVTKSCIINNIRYKFSSDGICLGKYTGWTKTSDGERTYWKNGKKQNQKA